METAETSTIQSTEETTSQEVAETQDTVNETTSQEATTDDTATTDNGTDETQEQPKEEAPSIDYEKSYKELQKAYTQGQQRIAELEKQMPQQPQIVNERGKVNPQYEQQFYFNLSRGELVEYKNLSFKIEDTQDKELAQEALNKAEQCLYSGNIQGFEANMIEAKTYFNPAYIDKISILKAQAIANKDNTINQAIQEQKKQALNALETELRQNQEVWELVDPQSPNYSEDVFGVVKEYFDSFGGVDTNRLASFIKAIEANGVRKYTANLEAQKTAEMNKQKASITGGDNVNIQTDMPSYAQIEKMSQEEYNKAYAKWGDKLLTAK